MTSEVPNDSNEGDNNTNGRQDQQPPISYTLSAAMSDMASNKLDFKHDENSVPSVVERLLGDDMDLDVYELTGLYARIKEACVQHKDKVPKRLKSMAMSYYYTVWQCIICASAQILGVSLILREVLNDLTNDNDGIPRKGKFCRVNDGGSASMKILSTLLQIYLFQFTLALFNTNQGKSLQHIKSSLCLNSCVKDSWLKHNNAVPHTLYNPYWVTLGVHVNNLTFVIVSVTSTFLIYATNNAIELILNGVALFFISEMDNFLVGSNDKKRVRDALRWYNKLKLDLDIKKRPLQVNSAFAVFNGFYMDLYNLLSVPLTFTLMFVVPVWNAVCY